MRFYRWVKKWAERVAALRIPLYAGNSAFFLLLSLFPLMSILLAILQRTSLQEADVLRLLAQVSPAALMPLGLKTWARTVSTMCSPSRSSPSAPSPSSGPARRDVQPPAGAERCRRRHRDAPAICACACSASSARSGCCWPSSSRSCSTSTENRCSACSARGGGFAARLLEFTMQELHLYSTVFLMIVFTLFYLVLPNRRRRLTRALPGALGAAIAWNVFSSALSFYVNHFPRASSLYGASRSCSSAFSGSISASRSSSMARFSIASSSAASAKIRSAPSYRGGAFPLW